MTAKFYRNAMNCKKCPGTNDENGCPWWTEYFETNVVTQEVRTEKGCMGQLFPKMMMHVISASNRPAAAIESVRNVIFDGFNGVSQVIGKRLGQPQNGKQIEHD